MKAYITKWALSQGITEREVELIDPGVVRDLTMDGVYYHRGHWFTIRENAEWKAHKMRNAKIASLKRQIAKLEHMTFSKP